MLSTGVDLLASFEEHRIVRRKSERIPIRELTRIALDYAIEWEMSWLDAVSNGGAEPEEIERATELVRQFREYRNRRFGKRPEFPG